MLNHHWPLRWLLLLGLLLPLGCKSKGPGMPSLTITSVNPSGIVGIPGQPVQFSANLDNASGNETYEWDFGSGGTPDDPTSPTPTVVLAGVDEYQGTLRVTDGGASAQTPFDFEVVAGAPVITGVSFDRGTGLPLAEASATVAAYGDPETFAWDFGGGAEPNTFEGEAPAVLLWNPGLYEGAVTASNGAGTSEPARFSFTVDFPVAPQWTIIELNEVWGEGWQSANPTPNVIVHDGKIVFACNSPTGLRLVRAVVENPAGPADFVSHVIDPIGWIDGSRRALVSWRGRLAVLYYRQVRDFSTPIELVCAVTEGGAPEGTEDWAHQTLLTNRSAFSADCVLFNYLDEHLVAIFAQRPLAGGDGPSVCRFFSTVESTPEEPADWEMQTLPLGAVPRTIYGAYDAFVLDGYLYALYSNLGALYLLAVPVETFPPAPEDWRGYLLREFKPGTAPSGTLFEVSGRLGIAYGGSGSSWLRLSDSSPVTEETLWAEVEIIAFPESQCLTLGITGVLAGGRLAVPAFDFCEHSIRLLRIIGADLIPQPDPRRAWEFQTIEPTGNTRQQPGAAVLPDGRIAVVYAVGPNLAGGQLRLALSDGPF